ncbi:MAG: acetyl-CoA carboxylase carboxyl transferase subunit alpha [Gammaproteobacteria bacterium TMED119]|nr:MAG: acetyl-CoA carboxylase carboxyl transferase subunit alpha [Gammaproteobacteria bacterium TMED119]RCL45827.1 MAG: acetyl-CoA carboxylase carboxyltransferase subunit alpha [Candidatus Thioglobus sp.]|tara:strand:+ start:2987 stop:3943 length:957 start_codon:yes stop_codon:yes gene_type:complete
MNSDYLEFEQPIAELEAKIDELRRVESDNEMQLGDEIAKLQAKCQSLTESTFSNLTAWQVAQIARHPNRPYTLDYISQLCTDFEELHGDRAYADDAAIICGIARFEGRAVAIIGHQKGRNTKENLHRNFGMPRPEGYRKALRIMETAEKFRLPILTFIDTPGAYPGVGAEERGQAQAIAKNLYRMAELKTPIISTVIGEGGSGGALAIGVCDHLSMLSYSTYSVISPEGCASILYKNADKAQDAAESMGITSKRLMELHLIDEIIAEPLNGAHRDLAATCANLKASLCQSLARLGKLDTQQLLTNRYQKLTTYGVFKD